MNRNLTSPDSARPLIELHDVVKRFRTPAGEFTALRNIHLSFQPGEFAAIMGKSGSGKSTLINMITGIDHPTSGVVRVGEVELHRQNESQMAVWRGRNLGIVFQFFQLLPMLTVLENTLLPMDFSQSIPAAKREARALEVLTLMGLPEVADQLPAALSGGQQQIAAIARALANDPPILIADEPTGNLDSRTAARVLDIFNDLAQRGKTILIVTHDPALARRATRRVLISDGELIDDAVGQALPKLPHPALLKISQRAVRRSYAPGAVLARQGAVGEGLYVITRGEVEILRQAGPQRLERLGRLPAGGYFSQLELAEAPDCHLIFRAAPEAPVEALCLTLGDFNHLLGESPASDRALRAAARAHGRQLCPPAAAA